MKTKCVKNMIPFEVEMIAIDGNRYRDTIRWCNCHGCIPFDLYWEITENQEIKSLKRGKNEKTN